MKPLLKNTLLSILIGAITFIAIGFLQDKGIRIPDTPASIAELLIIVVAIYIATLLSNLTSQAASTPQETGTVKWFNTKKGYGFITRDQGDDVFVHFRNIVGDGRRAVSEGQRVSFIVIPGDKGLQADQVSAV